MTTETLRQRLTEGLALSFFTPPQVLALVQEAGFAPARHVSAAALAERYFAGKTDGLRSPNNVEDLLIASTWPA